MSTLWLLHHLRTLDTSSLDFLRYLHCLIRHDEEDQYLTSLQGSQLTELVDFLDHTLNVISANDGVTQQCLHKLQAICGHYTILPSSCIASGKIARLDDGPIALSPIADVWGGTHDGKKVTIKCFRVPLSDKQAFKKSFSKEAVIWKRLRHPNIVPFIGVRIDALEIISESMPNGTLTEFVKGNPDASKISLLLDVAEGLNYLHSNQAIHGNLNGSSILVDCDGHARLTDFEFGSIVRGMNSTRQASEYTVAQSAPEILEGTGVVARETDVFALGMIVIEIFTGRPPFSEFPTSIITSKIRSGERPDRPQEAQGRGLTDSVWDATIRCWDRDPTQRPKMTEVVGLLRESFVSPISVEADLGIFFRVCGTWDKDDQGDMAREFADRLEADLHNADLHEEKRKQYLTHMQRLYSTFGVLPSSSMLPPEFVQRDHAPFASGSCSTVYRATFRGLPVIIKVLNVAAETDQKKLRRLLVEEVIVWKWLRHKNILPFVGIMFEPSLISIASEHMDNGNIMDFIKANRDYNRLRLLVDAVTGLEYLHEHNIIHGDLKGVNILIDSECRARLADFGLAAIVGEVATGTGGGLWGTVRWMAPELFFPNEFGFTGELRKQLPSKETDIYAIGMTIFEVLTGCVPFANIVGHAAVVFTVIEGVRPSRPPSGFSDTLWELLEATWAVQHAGESRRRPPASTVLDRSKECVDDWGESIVPITPESWEVSDSGGGVTAGGA